MLFFFFKQKTAYDMRISDWSSDVCSSDLIVARAHDAGKARRRIAASHSLAGEKPRKRNAVGRRYAPDACVLKAGPMTRPASTSVAKRVDGLVRLHAPSRPDGPEIGRASCRERVCQYV